ncbi:hypothetical protein ACHAW5_000493 [Stephanodiscus triporus]|uniref:Uncharacterized protein n=1 Tax=Stephanodiscus triporus TaxID=2934178 RepID=A0ABD3PTR6_9STRA
MKTSALVIVASLAFFARDAEGGKGNLQATSVCTQACDDPKQVKVCKTTQADAATLVKETKCVTKLAADRLVKRPKSKFVCDECV